MTDLEKEFKRLRNLKNYKNYDKNTLERIAQIKVWKRQVDIEAKFQNTAEKTTAEAYFDNYLNNYQLKDFNEVQITADLVFEEVLKLRVQKEIDKIIADKNTKFVPDKLIQSLHSIEERIWKLKEKAGIASDREQDDLTALQEYEKKLDLHIAFNRNEFTFWSPVICKECGNKDVEPILLRKKVKDFDGLKHPFFSGRFYYNRRGMELVKEKFWTKEQYAWVFQTSVAYVDWCIKNESKIVEVDDIEDEEVQKFINEHSYVSKPTIPKNIKKNK